MEEALEIANGTQYGFGRWRLGRNGNLGLWRRAPGRRARVYGPSICYHAYPAHACPAAISSRASGAKRIR